ncbi:MAG: putative metal-binding protein [Prosthecobacter sp.]|nr:putative metal-binding protein [Prosthecobacter sp.]
MKLITLLSILALTASVRAETTLTMTGVHNCCGSCAKGITKAGSIGEGVTIDVPEKSSTVTITSKKKGDAMKAAEAIIAAGYFGKIEGGEPAKTTSKPATAAKPEAKMTKATVSGVHLCCKKCETAAANAVKTVPGITKSDIVAKATSFTVEGEFTKSELTAALNDAGFAGDIK